MIKEKSEASSGKAEKMEYSKNTDREWRQKTLFEFWEKAPSRFLIRVSTAPYGYMVTLMDAPVNASFLTPKGSMDQLRQILYNLRWNTEYISWETVVPGEGWHMTADFPDIRFRSSGYLSYPPDYGQAKNAILSEMNNLYRNYYDQKTVPPVQPNRSNQYTLYLQRSKNKYFLYHGEEQIGTATVSTDKKKEPVLLQFGDQTLISEVTGRNPQQRFYRCFYRKRGPEETFYGKLDRNQDGMSYYLYTDTQKILIKPVHPGYDYFLDGRKIAQLRRVREEEQQYFIQRYLVDLEYYMTVSEELPRDLARLLLSFPCL